MIEPQTTPYTRTTGGAMFCDQCRTYECDGLVVVGEQPTRPNGTQTAALCLPCIEQAAAMLRDAIEKGQRQ